MAYNVKVLADSVSSGRRIVTFEATFPRFILAEVNTHCMLSRCSASSRAVPVEKRLTALKEDPFIPKAFGRNKSGMQPGEALEGEDAKKAEELWRTAASDAAYHTGRLAALGAHKQYANRLIEPYLWHTAIITATDTEWPNFFHLRDSKEAQGEFKDLAAMMHESYEEHSPTVLADGEWHLPFVRGIDQWNLEVRGYTQRKLAEVSAARCARVSYLTHDGKRDVEKDFELYGDRLVPAGHMSPLEHPARPMEFWELNHTRLWDVSFDNGPMIRGQWYRDPCVGREIEIGGVDRKITGVRGPHNYCGKLNGWCSLRSMIPGEWDALGKRP